MIKDYAEYSKQFEACKIDAAKFTHRDHIGVAHEFLRRYDFLTAVGKYSNCIRTIAENAGADQKFNTTITVAFLSIIAERMSATNKETVEDFLDENKDLLSRGLLDNWYSQERLGSEQARERFLMPDL